MSGSTIEAGTQEEEEVDTSSPSDVLSQSDEDFLKDGSDDSPSSTLETEPVTEPNGETPVVSVPASADSTSVVPDPVVEDEPKAKDPVDPETTEPVATEAVDPRQKYEDDYNRIMAPFQANGKTITLKSPEEAIQLMQMGANYTRKMQAIAPQRAILTMLQNNGLLDQDKLSYLIDLDKKNPDAIKKLIKESGIDPLDIDVSAEPNYQPGNHRVADKEVAFNTVLDDMKSTDSGLDTLLEINSKWDQASKTFLWEKPEIMEAIHTQRGNGIYARITEEMDRRTTLGQIPSGTSFLAAYELVGNEIAAVDGFADLLAPQPVTTPKPVETPKPAPVAIRPATIKPQIANNEKAAAASNNRAVPTAAETVINPLSESDEAFLKRTEGRF